MTLLGQWAVQGGFLGLEMDPFFHESSGKSVASLLVSGQGE